MSSSENQATTLPSPRIIVVCGPPGVGKSTVARQIRNYVGGEHYRTDIVRKELFDDPSYTPTETEALYERMTEHAIETVRDGSNAILDGTYRWERLRDDIATAASNTTATCHFVRVTCPQDVVRERLRQREDDPSDADFSVYREIRETFDPLDRHHIIIDNSNGVGNIQKRIKKEF